MGRTWRGKWRVKNFPWHTSPLCPERYTNVILVLPNDCWPSTSNTSYVSLWPGTGYPRRGSLETGTVRERTETTSLLHRNLQSDGKLLKTNPVTRRSGKGNFVTGIFSPLPPRPPPRSRFRSRVLEIQCLRSKSILDTTRQGSRGLGFEIGHVGFEWEICMFNVENVYKPEVDWCKLVFFRKTRGPRYVKLSELASPWVSPTLR